MTSVVVLGSLAFFWQVLKNTMMHITKSTNNGAVTYNADQLAPSLSKIVFVVLFNLVQQGNLKTLSEFHLKGQAGSPLLHLNLQFSWILPPFSLYSGHEWPIKTSLSPHSSYVVFLQWLRRQWYFNVTLLSIFCALQFFFLSANFHSFRVAGQDDTFSTPVIKAAWLFTSNWHTINASSNKKTHHTLQRILYSSIYTCKEFKNWNSVHNNLDSPDIWQK